MVRKLASPAFVITFLILGFLIYPASLFGNPSSPLQLFGYREGLQMKTDFLAEVGTQADRSPLVLWCDPAVAAEIDISITNTSSVFTLHPHAPFPPSIQCGSYYWISVRFEPTAAGLISDVVTVSSTIGTASMELIGNAIIAESPAYWMVDLPTGTSAGVIFYHPLLKKLFITDYNSHRVIVFSPASRSVIAMIPVGRNPVGMVLSPDGKQLYVAHVLEQSISEIDVATLAETRRINLPSLGDTPYALAFIGKDLLLIGGFFGGPFHMLDLNSGVLTLRSDIGSGGIEPSFATSKDFSTTAIVEEPQASPTFFIRYDHATGSIVRANTLDTGEIEREVIINGNGSRIVSNNAVCGIGGPDLRVTDRDLKIVGRIEVFGCKAVQMSFNESGDRIFTTADQFLGRTYSIDEVDVSNLLQTRSLQFFVPDGYGPYGQTKAMAFSEDDRWIYSIFIQAGNDPPSKLVAMKVMPEPGISSLALHKNGTGDGEVSSHFPGINCGTDCWEDYQTGMSVALEPTPAPGSAFFGWSGHPDCSDGVVLMDTDKGCVANFYKATSVTIKKAGKGSGSVVSDPAGINCGSQCSAPFAQGFLPPVLTATADPGSVFVGWNGGGCTHTSNICGPTMNADSVVTAKFAPANSVNVTAPNGGEQWRIHSVENIRWSSNGVNGAVKISISRDGGNTWKTLLKNVTNTGSRNWKVTGPATTQALLGVCTIKTSSNCDTSAANFSIQP